MTSRRWLHAGLLAMMCAALYARTLNQSHPYPVYDEVAYLNLARDYSDQGFTNLVSSYLTAQNHEGNRQPLYLWNLSLVMDETPADFSRGKLLSLAHMMILIGVVYFWTRRRWDADIALFAAAVIAFSPVALTLTDTILADVLFTIFYFSTLMLLTEQSNSWKKWFGCGVLCGLSYMTKGNGYFLFFSIAAVIWWEHRVKFIGFKSFALSVAGFFTATFPLIIRNLRVWHTPFYNDNNKLFWLDSWNQFVVMQNGPLWDKISMSWYFQHHTALDALKREVTGAIRGSGIFLQSLAVGPSHENAMIATGVVMLALAIVGVILQWREGQKKQVIGIITTSVVLMPIFAWGAMADMAHARYFFPMVVTLIPFSAIGMHFLFKRFLQITPLFIGAGSLYVMATCWNGFLVNPLMTWHVSDGWRNTSFWLQSHIDENGYLFDNYSPYSPWECCRLKRLGYPFQVPALSLSQVLAERRIRTVLLDSHLIGNDPYPEKYGEADEFGRPHF